MVWYAIDVIQPAVDKTKAFFTGPNLKSKWIKIGILIFIFSLLSGGGGGGFSNLNVSDTIDSESLANAIKNIGSDSAPESVNSVIGSALGLPELPNMTGFASMVPSITPELITFLIIIAIIILIVAFIFGIILTLIKNMAFFAIIESTETNEVHIRAYMKKFWSKAISVTKFEIVVSIISLICIVIILAALATFVISLLGLSGSVPGFITGLAAFGIILIPLAILAVIVLIILILIEYVFGQLAMYWMYFNEMGSFEAFKKSLSLAKNNLAQIIVLLLVQFGLGIVAAIISVIALLVVAIPFVILAVIVAVILIMIAAASASLLWLVIAIGILLLIIGIMLYALCLNIALAPIGLFFFNYNIMFLQALLGKETTFTRQPKTISNSL